MVTPKNLESIVSRPDSTAAFGHHVLYLSKYTKMLFYACGLHKLDSSMTATDS